MNTRRLLSGLISLSLSFCATAGEIEIIIGYNIPVLGPYLPAIEWN
jgi:hypothetical protein